MIDIKKLSDRELCGQLLCIDISDKDTPEQIENEIKNSLPAGIFVANMSPEKIKFYRDLVEKYTKIPCFVCADVEYGLGNSVIKGTKVLPTPMAWGATNNPNLIKIAGKLTAKICKKCGIDYTFSPVVDINYNLNNPVTYVRSASDNHKLVIDISGAYLDGLREGGLVTACKHFPGDGVDDRDQHNCTTVNSLDFETWLATFGEVYKNMINRGTESIMIGHIALPSFETEFDELGYMPATLSKSLMVDLLRGKLGFTGCIVSDAMSMVGASSRLPLKELAVEFVRSGGDLVLFPEKNDINYLETALKNGKLSRQRVVDAVTHVLQLKQKAGLFDNNLDNDTDDLQVLIDKLDAVGQEIADKSIKTVRDIKNILKEPLNKNSKLLCVYLFKETSRVTDTEHIFDTLENELIKRSCKVDTLINPSHYKLESVIDKYDAVLVCTKMMPDDFASGGSIRLGWECVLPFWRGYILRHKKLIFASFGNPYVLYQFPFISTCINVFSPSVYSQKAFVKRLFHEIEESAKNPVNLKGFFNFGE